MSSTTTRPIPAPSYPGRPGSVSIPPASGVHHRWSPARFATDREVEAADLKAVLEAARWSASCFGEEPWRFLVARRDAPWRHAVEDALSEGNRWARRASVLLVGVARRHFTRNGKPNSYARHDLGMSLSSLMVEAMARGLVTHAMAGFDADAVRDSFSVPDDHDVVWTLALGHWDPEMEDERLERKDARERRRKPLEELVFGSRFGEPVEL